MSSGKHSPVSRRRFLQGAATLSAAAIAGRGVYAVLDDVVRPPRAWAATAPPRQEQYIVDAVSFILDNGARCSSRRSTTTCSPPGWPRAAGPPPG